METFRQIKFIGKSVRGIMAKAQDCGLKVSEFEHQSGFYVHFRTNIVGKGMNSLTYQTMS